jgi:hypothetical protein
MRVIPILFAVCLVCLIACQPVASASRPDFVIVPGHRLGSIRLGEEDAALAWLGAPDPNRGDAAMGHFWEVWPSKTTGNVVAIYSVRDGGGGDETHVVQIVVTSPEFHTRSGVHAGMSLTEIRRHYPGLAQTSNPDDSGKTGSYAAYDDVQAGIGFQIYLPTGRCTGIVVHDAGSPLMLEYDPIPDDVNWKKIFADS